MWPSLSHSGRSKKEKICSVRWHKTFSMHSVSRYNSKMAQDIEKCNRTQKLQLLISNNFCLKFFFIQRIFKALFAKKLNCAIRAEAKPVGRSKKNLQQKLRIVIGNNFCLEKDFVQRIFKALPPPPKKKKKLCIQGRGQTRGAILLVQSKPRFLSYKIAYQIWLS